MVVSRKKLQEIETISSFREFKNFLENKVLSGELDLTEGSIHQYVYDTYLFCQQAGIGYDQVPDKDRTLQWKRQCENRYAPKTLSKRFTSVNHYLKFHGLDWSLPLPRHSKRQEEPIPLSEKQVMDMVELYERKHLYTKSMMIYLSYKCAIRVGALVDLKLSDIDHNTRKVFLRKTKGGKSRRVPLSMETYKKLDRYIKNLRPTPKNEEDKDYLFIEERNRTRAQYSYIHHSVKQVAFALGIPTRTYPHLLRHSRIKQLRSLGYNWERIMAMTGHADVRSLADYIHAESEDELQEALDKDECKAPIPQQKPTESPQQNQETQQLELRKEILKLEIQKLELQQQQTDSAPKPERAPKDDKIGYI